MSPLCFLLLTIHVHRLDYPIFHFGYTSYTAAYYRATSFLNLYLLPSPGLREYSCVEIRSVHLKRNISLPALFLYLLVAHNCYPSRSYLPAFLGPKSAANPQDNCPIFLWFSHLVSSTWSLGIETCPPYTDYGFSEVSLHFIFTIRDISIACRFHLSTYCIRIISSRQKRSGSRISAMPPYTTNYSFPPFYKENMRYTVCAR